MGGKTILTAKEVGGLRAGEVASQGFGYGVGSLEALGVKGGGVAFYFRYTMPDGQRDRLPLGSWAGLNGAQGLSLADARAKAQALSTRYQNGERDLRRVLESEQRKAEAAREEEMRVAARTADTLGALLLAYVEVLNAKGSLSARAVENSLRRHVERAMPALWRATVHDVTTGELVSIVRSLTTAGSATEARKVRGYLRAAFACAVGAAHDASAPESLARLKVQKNPARDIAPVKSVGPRRERALSVQELRAYWRRIAKGHEFALLRFHLLTGGQRVEQLARATMDDWDRDTNTLHLRDPKGKRPVARSHYVPLLPEAIACIEEMQSGAIGPYLFTVTAGKSGVDYNGIKLRLGAVAKAMQKAGELPGGPFTLGDLRRTVETRLAADGITPHVRAQLQSHGLSGVQAKHYDRHNYLAEKRGALESLQRIFAHDAATVTAIGKARARKA